METQKDLSRFRPAEVLVLIEGNKMSLASMMQATYLDLISRGVLSVDEREQGGNRLRYVGLGPKAKTEALRKYEVGFVKMFEKNSNVSHFLHNKYISLVRKYSQGAQGFRTELLMSPALRGMLKRSFWDYLKGTWQLSPEGMRCREELRKQLAMAEGSFVENRPTPSNLNLQLTVAASVLMVQSVSFRKTWMTREASAAPASADVGAGADWLIYSSDFDDGATGCGGDSGCWGGHSGCGSDGGHSGCSGDSGCGGSGCGGSGCGGGGCGGSGCSS
jgi:hypothetical protein